MIDYSNLTVSQKNQLNIDAKYIALSFKLMLLPMTIILFFRGIFFFEPGWACSLIENSKLLAAWPKNLDFYNQLSSGSYPHLEGCHFLALNSIASVSWLIWLIVKINFEIRRKDCLFISGVGHGALIAFSVSIISLLVASFVNYDSFYAYSLLHRADVNALKSIITIVIFYVSLGFIIDRILLYFRSSYRNSL